MNTQSLPYGRPSLAPSLVLPARLNQTWRDLEESLAVGDILTLKQSGPVAGVLAPVVKHFEKDFQDYGPLDWHCMVAIKYHGRQGGWEIGESLGNKGIARTWLRDYYTRCCSQGFPRVYRWFDPRPTERYLEHFYLTRARYGYDSLVYLFTGIQYLVASYTGLALPTYRNHAYTCWEPLWELGMELNQPLPGGTRYPLITNFLREAKAKQVIYTQYEGW